MGRLDRKVAVVTGAGRGIGRATVLRFAAEGAAVVVNDVDPEHYGQPEDVANAHLFLASPESDYISGVVLPVAGAMLGA